MHMTAGIMLFVALIGLIITKICWLDGHTVSDGVGAFISIVSIICLILGFVFMNLDSHNYEHRPSKEHTEWLNRNHEYLQEMYNWAND